MKKRVIIGLLASFILTACAGDKSVKVTSLQKKDKSLSCSEVMLEINESEFYRKTAEKNKNPKAKSILMPLGYISTYVDAEEAVEAADSRITYLNRIYDILDCDNQNSRQPARQASYPALAAPTPVMAAPMMPMMQQPYYGGYYPGYAAPSYAPPPMAAPMQVQPQPQQQAVAPQPKRQAAGGDDEWLQNNWYW